MAFEELDFPFMLLGRLPSFECSEIPALSGWRIFFGRIEAVSAGLEFSNHDFLRSESIRFAAGAFTLSIAMCGSN